MEQAFSRSGYLADPNMDPQALACLTRIAINQKVYEPPEAAIKDRYFAKFRGHGAEGVNVDGAAGCSSDPISM